MNDEIREILENIKRQNEWDGIEYFKTPLSTKDANKLLDYITNLQQENEELKKNQRYYKNGVFSLEYDKETLSDMVDDYKSRIEKAVEYINNYFVLGAGSDYQNNLLNILQNGSDEE